MEEVGMVEEKNLNSSQEEQQESKSENNTNEFEKDSNESDKTIEKLQEQLKTLEEENSVLKQQNSELKDSYLRSRADFDNYKKRIQREFEEKEKFLVQKVIEDILPALDDLERAVDAAKDADDVTALHEGVTMISSQILSVLEKKWGLVKFSALNEPFDPNKHEAFMIEQGDYKQPVVIEEFQKGYSLHERIIRPARVKVGMPAPSGQNNKDDMSDSRAEEHTQEKQSDEKGEN
ncbi:nucleotide exchange factor GrpE [Spirochaetia bacterium 38H-sp]|uniref:Protein GrpE n=1 Tax=Rarispira pelagica TaxID=3141764 RepID=A0ABU9UDS1_9SPIR